MFQYFSGSNSKQLNYYIIPLLADDKPDADITHVAKSDILNNASYKGIP